MESSKMGGELLLLLTGNTKLPGFDWTLTKHFEMESTKW
jgi:hypothetical protein